MCFVGWRGFFYPPISLNTNIERKITQMKFAKDVPPVTNEPLVNVKQVASYLGVSQSTIERYLQQGFIPSISFGSTKRMNVRFRLSEIDAWLLRRGRINHGRSTIMPTSTTTTETASL